MPTKNSASSVRKQVLEWLRTYKVEVVFAVIGLLAMNAILLAKAYWETDQINPATAGELGDFVGGYVGTAFVLLTALLLYRTLRSQREGAQLQPFEARYFELVRLHRENVAEMKVGGREGRRIFLPMLRELWAAREVAEDCARSHAPMLTSREKLHVAYYSLFFGAGGGSSRMLRVSLSEFPQAFVEAVDSQLKDELIRAAVKVDFDLSYEPFEGHQSRLGHYYRHLYQSVSYVHRQDIEIDRYEYVKTIRAQLSTHEQALLLINSLCPLGARWWDDGLLIQYKMVKNLPSHFINPSVGIDFESLFPLGYFEWEERVSGRSGGAA